MLPAKTLVRILRYTLNCEHADALSHPNPARSDGFVGRQCSISRVVMHIFTHGGKRYCSVIDDEYPEDEYARG